MSKNLTAYFSAGGVTAKAAKNLAQAAKSELYEIAPEVPYTADDLKWQNKSSRSSIETSDKSFRPALADRNADISRYDTIYLCFPIWWYSAPPIVRSFLESYDFSGKTIILCPTSGGSGFGKIAEELKSSVSESTVIKEGKFLNGTPSVSVLEKWLAE